MLTTFPSDATILPEAIQLSSVKSTLIKILSDSQQEALAVASIARDVV